MNTVDIVIGLGATAAYFAVPALLPDHLTRSGEVIALVWWIGFPLAAVVLALALGTF